MPDCKVSPDKAKAWLARWEREFRGERWIETPKGGFVPAPGYEPQLTDRYARYHRDYLPAISTSASKKQP